MTKYNLQAKVLGKYRPLTITKDDYTNIKISIEYFKHTLQLETNFDITFRLYIEAEKEMLNIASNHSFYPNISNEMFYECRVIMNARINSFLLSARFYLDKIGPQTIKSTSPELEKELQKFISNIYDTCQYYPLMYRMRNYVAHGEQPVHIVSLPSSWVDGYQSLEFSCEIYSEKKSLQKSSSYNKSTLEPFAEKINLMIGLRSYMKNLWKILEKQRELRKKHQSEYYNTIHNTLEKYREHESKYSLNIPLTAQRINSEDHVTDNIIIQTNQANLCANLENKHKLLGSLDKSYITSKH